METLKFNMSGSSP